MNRKHMRGVYAVEFAVVGLLVFILLFGSHGWFGGYLRAHHIRVVFAVPGIVLATIFVIDSMTSKLAR